MNREDDRFVLYVTRDLVNEVAQFISLIYVCRTMERHDDVFPFLQLQVVKDSRFVKPMLISPQRVNHYVTYKMDSLLRHSCIAQILVCYFRCREIEIRQTVCYHAVDLFRHG